MRGRHEGMRMSAIIVQSVYRGHQHRTAQVRPNSEVQDIHGLETFDVATMRIQTGGEWFLVSSATGLCGCARACCRQFAGGLRHGSIANA
jgi:hypothetical protein